MSYKHTPLWPDQLSSTTYTLAITLTWKDYKFKHSYIKLYFHLAGYKISHKSNEKK